jgi:hypothetical protein
MEKDTMNLLKRYGMHSKVVLLSHWFTGEGFLLL